MTFFGKGLGVERVSLNVELLRRLYATRLFRYAVTLLLLGVVAWRIHPERLSSALSSARPQYVLAACLLTIPFLYLKALRWSLMLQSAGIEASFAEASLSLIGGMGLALVTPARLGELIRAAYLSDRRKLKISGLVMIDKAFDVLALCGLSVVGTWVLLGHLAGILMFLATASGLLFIYIPGVVHRQFNRLGGRLPLQARIASVWSSIESLSPAKSTLFLALTVLSFVVVLCQFGIVLLSWRSWSLDIVFLTFPLVVLTNVLPITIGGLGVREAAAALLLGHYGVSPAHAALSAFLMFFMNTALPGIFGVIFLPPVRTSTTIAQPADGP
ncbi:MAG: lysylphosphatidylglycerol synthase transmembrane domain-containing protein [Chloroflexota bacterium]